MVWEARSTPQPDEIHRPTYFTDEFDVSELRIQFFVVRRKGKPMIFYIIGVVVVVIVVAGYLGVHI